MAVSICSINGNATRRGRLLVRFQPNGWIPGRILCGSQEEEAAAPDKGTLARKSLQIVIPASSFVMNDWSKIRHA